MHSGGSKESCVRWGTDPRTRKGNFEAKGAGPEHARTCPAVDILKATQRGAAKVR